MQEGKTQKNHVRSMTEGSPLGLILAFMLPLLLGNLFQQAYNMADGIIVGRLLGANALAAVGSSTSVQFLTLGLCIGSCAGFAIPIAQSFGAGDMKRMRSFVYHALVLSVVLAALMTLVTTVFCRSIVTLMQTPADIFDDAYQYLFIIFCGIPFTILYNITASILRAVGNSRAPFLFLAVSTVLNIFLDLLCIAVFHWGCAGAAAATIASQALSGFFCLLYILKKVPQLHPGKEDRVWSRAAAGHVLAMGIPMGLQYSITAIGSMVMQSANNSLGSVYVSGFTAGTKLKQLFICPYDAMATALATFVGQNYGAMRMDRVKKGMRQMLVISLLYGAAAGILMIFFGRSMSGWFLSEDNGQALDAAALYLRCMGYLYWVLGPLNICRNVIQALGFSGRAVISGVIEMTARSVFATVLVPVYGYTAICWTDQSAWITATIYLIFMSTVVIRRRTREEETLRKQNQTAL